MPLYGTQQKCKVCEKTVYPMELLSADGVDFHKSCFRCTHCKGTLKLGNYSSMEGVLYCKPHFEQLFKESGNYNKNFQSAAKSSDKVTPELTRTPSKAAGMFSGTQEKCATCGKTAYPLEKISVFDGTPIDCGSYSSTNKETSIDENILEFPVHPKAIKITKRRRKEKVTVENQSFHKTCFKCSHGGCYITPSTYAALEGILYCKHHFSQLFKEKGSYNHLLTSASIKRPAAAVPEA